MDQTWWIRRPRGDDPGTLNACRQALDAHVIAGHADRPALRTAAGEESYADLLAEVAALAGALRLVGVGAGDAVALDGLTPREAVLTELAGLRLGAHAVGTGADAGTVRVAVARDAGRVPGAEAVVLTGDGEPREGRDVPWPVAMSAGRTAPAEVVPVPPDTPAVGSTTHHDLLAGRAPTSWSALLDGGTLHLG